VNPFTGLPLKDYLDGREDRYGQLAAAAGIAEAAGSSDGGSGDAAGGGGGGGRRRRGGAKLGAADAAAVRQQLAASTGPPRMRDGNWASDDTETRFETESDVMELCDLNEILGTIDEAEEIVARARLWRWKPYGEATLRFAQDGAGAPLALMQDALHYPHGTRWMAPGPLGQVHPLPEDPALRAELLRAAKNYAHVHSLYNFDWDPEPGSAQWKVDQRIRRAGELHDRRVQQALDAMGEEERGGGSAAGAPALASVAAAAAGPRPAQQQQQQRQRVAGPSGGFASMSLGMGRASRAVLGALEAAARSTVTSRPRLARPARRAGQQQAAAAQQQQ